MAHALSDCSHVGLRSNLKANDPGESEVAGTATSFRRELNEFVRSGEFVESIGENVTRLLYVVDAQNRLWLAHEQWLPAPYTAELRRTRRVLHHSALVPAGQSVRFAGTVVFRMESDVVAAYADCSSGHYHWSRNQQIAESEMPHFRSCLGAIMESAGVTLKLANPGEGLHPGI
jgi:hypothetical protein